MFRNNRITAAVSITYGIKRLMIGNFDKESFLYYLYHYIKVKVPQNYMSLKKIPTEI